MIIYFFLSLVEKYGTTHAQKSIEKTIARKRRFTNEEDHRK